MNTHSARRCLLGLALATLGAGSTAQSQDLVEQVLISFPAGTTRVEYARPAQLRKIPEYSQLREQFLGPRLKAMDGALATLGIEDRDVDEVALGWLPRQAPSAETPEVKSDDTPTALSGLLGGRFHPQRISESATAHELVFMEIAGSQAYCQKRKEVPAACFVVLSDSLAAFGEPGALAELLEVRSGTRSSLAAERRFTRLINTVNRHAAIWGIATGSTVPEWFRGWLPGEGQTRMDWARVFKRVEEFTYSLEVSDRIELTAKLGAESSEVAGQLEQLFAGLRMLISVMWQAQSPERPNPLAGLAVAAEGRSCILKLGTSLKDAAAYQSFPMRPAAAPAPDAKPISAP